MKIDENRFRQLPYIVWKVMKANITTENNNNFYYIYIVVTSLIIKNVQLQYTENSKIAT